MERRTASSELGKFNCQTSLKALYIREEKRYFSSPIYVSNTMAGSVLAVLASAAMLFLDLEALQKKLPVSLPVLAPVIWAVICCMMPACSVSVTMEGKQIWQIKSLPISMKRFLDSKLLWNFTLLLPAYILSQGILTEVFRPDFKMLLWQLGMPLAIMAFSCCFALSADLQLHNFDFTKDEAAVKQSLSAVIGGLGGPAAGIMICGCLIIFKGSPMAQILSFLLTAAAALGCYAVNCRKQIVDL